MQFLGKTEVMIFLFAAFTMALIYNQALKNDLGAVFTGSQGILGKIMGQTNAGVFQKPF